MPRQERPECHPSRRPAARDAAKATDDRIDRSGPLSAALERLETAVAAIHDGEARYLIVAIDGTPVGTFHAYCDAMPNDGTAVLTVVDRQSNKQVDVAISVGGFSR